MTVDRGRSSPDRRAVPKAVEPSPFKSLRSAAPFKMLRNSEHSRVQRIADAITRFSGTMTFVGVHIVWFGAWIV